jgi:hypothetical protein
MGWREEVRDCRSVRGKEEEGGASRDERLRALLRSREDADIEGSNADTASPEDEDMGEGVPGAKSGNAVRFVCFFNIFLNASAFAYCHFLISRSMPFILTKSSSAVLLSRSTSLSANPSASTRARNLVRRASASGRGRSPRSRSEREVKISASAYNVRRARQAERSEGACLPMRVEEDLDGEDALDLDLDLDGAE